LNSSCVFKNRAKDIKMKQTITILTLFYSLISFSQFDRKIIEPLVENPSFVGSANENRLSATYSTRKLKNRQTVSYDFFSNKLGGGWGIAASNNKLFDSREATLRVAYSPKITPKNKEVTWAPGIGVLYNRVYLQEFNLVSFASTPGYSTIKNSFQGTVSLARNSKKTLTTALVSYDPILRIFKNEFSFFLKLDKRRTNKFSSTIGIGQNFIVNKYSGLSEGFLGEVSDVESGEVFLSDSDIRFEIPEKQVRINFSYYVRWRGFRLGSEINYKIWSKNREVSAGEESQFREISYLGSEDPVTINLSYTYKKITFSGGYIWGFYKTFSNETTSDGRQTLAPNLRVAEIEPISTNSKFIFNYRQVKIGLMVNF